MLATGPVDSDAVRRFPAFVIGLPLAAACVTLPAGPLEARWSIAGEPLLLRSAPAFAGAVSSIQFRGVEHLDASDHGRLLQGAISFDGRGECLNPTQAGASSDGPRRTTSRLLSASAGPAGYVTRTRMAFWLRPGQSCTGEDGRPRAAANRARLSDVIYSQHLTPNWRGQPHAVHHAISFTTAVPRRTAVVEALTVYAPARFSVFHTFDGQRLVPDPDVAARPGEQPRAVALSTPDGRHAIGFIAARSRTEGEAPARYGRFTYGHTHKLNVVFRPAGPYAPGPHAYEAVTVIGALAEVERAFAALDAQPAR